MALEPEQRPWRAWLEQEFPVYVRAGFAPRHVALWDWIDALTPGTRPRPRVEIWPRGGAKSTTAELGCARIGRRLTRRFALYVSKTQDLADRHVQSVAGLFEAMGIERAVNSYGSSKGWSRQLLRTSNGFNVMSLGLDKGVRGIKLDEFRPDLIIIDDVDDRHDSDAIVEKKIQVITESILPAGSSDCAILFIQNRIHDRSIAAKMVDGTADFLLDRMPAVQEPAVIDLEYVEAFREDGTRYYQITGGTPTWEGQNLAVCEFQMNDWGRRAFLREAQHKTKLDDNGLWNRMRDIERYRVTKAPDLVRVIVGVDPSATATGDEAGVVVGGIAEDGQIYIIDDRSLQGSPLQWAMAAVSAYHQHRADALVAEDNNGGEMVSITIGTVPGAPPVKRIHASRGKQTRAEPVQKLYEDGRVHHVGIFSALEDELCSWTPGDPSPNRLDALVWVVTELALNGGIGVYL